MSIVDPEHDDRCMRISVPTVCSVFVIAPLVLLAMACGDATEPPSAATGATDATATATAAVEAPATMAATPEAPSGPLFGVAGLIPRNFPSSEGADWIAMYEGLPESGGLLGVYGGWTDDRTPRGEIPEVFRAAFAANEQYEFTPVVGLGVFSEDIVSGTVSPTVEWSNPDERAQYFEAAVAIAEQYQPPFMIIGAEINRLWEQQSAAYDGFVAAFPEIYAAVKAASPQTQVGVGFQLEFLRGAGYLSGESREPRWELLDAFAAADLLAFSSYPYFDFGSPDEMPSDYYAEVAAHVAVPIAFTEMGWPSRPLSTAPDSEYGGSPEEQAAFASRFIELIDGVDVAFALWSFQHDLGELGGPAFDSVALRLNDGTAKPVLDVWGAASAR